MSQWRQPSQLRVPCGGPAPPEACGGRGGSWPAKGAGSVQKGATFVRSSRTSCALRTHFVRSAHKVGIQGVQGDNIAHPTNSVRTSYALRTHFVRTSYEVRTKLAPTGADNVGNKWLACMDGADRSRAWKQHAGPRWASCTAWGEGGMKVRWATYLVFTCALHCDDQVSLGPTAPRAVDQLPGGRRRS